jgi:hypothetical protein
MLKKNAHKPIITLIPALLTPEEAKTIINEAENMLNFAQNNIPNISQKRH